MTVYEAVVSRLAMLGYTVTDNDETGLNFLIDKCEKDILADINQRVLPDGLFYVHVDMVAGQFLYDKKAAGGLDGLEGFDFSAPAKSITEGDVAITFAGASDGASNAEARFDALLAGLMHPPEMVVGSPAHKKAVQSLWVGKATITVLDGVLNPANGRTEPQERILAADIRCRISHKSVVSTEPNEEAAQVAQSVVLYIDPSVDIPEGSKITVTQNGVTRDYERSGKPAVYSCHQEVPLELFKEWA